MTAPDAHTHRPDIAPDTAPSPPPSATPWPAWAGFVLLLAAGTAGLAWLGTPQGHSYGFNLPWFIAFEAAQAGGTVYPRHLPELWFGFGGLDFFFYGPLPFHLAAGPARWLCGGCAPQTVLGLTGGMLWAASALALLPLARRLLPSGAALAAAAIYALMPYHLGVDWFVRQAIGEFAAYVFVPLMAAAMLAAMDGGTRRPTAGARLWGPTFALATAGLALSHLPSMLIAAHVFGVIFVVWALRHPRAALPVLGWLVGWGALGLALCALYWLPALVLLGDVSPQALATPQLTARNWLLPGALSGGPDPGLSLLLAIALAGAVGAVLVAAALRPTMDRAHTDGVLLWMLLPAGLVAALSVAPAAPLWENWILGRVQFPFRLMMFADLAAALAGGVLVAALARATGWRRQTLPLAGLALLALSLAAALPKALDPARDGRAAIGSAPRMAGAPEYLPPAAFDPPARVLAAAGRELWRVPGEIETRLPDLRAAITGHGGLEPLAPRSWRLVPDGSDTVVAPLFYWRHFEAVGPDGVTVVLRPTDSGLTEIVLPRAEDVSAGTAAPAHVDIHLPWHWSEWAGAALGLGALVVLAGLPLWRRRRTR